LAIILLRLNNAQYDVPEAKIQVTVQDGYYSFANRRLLQALLKMVGRGEDTAPTFRREL